MQTVEWVNAPPPPSSWASTPGSRASMLGNTSTGTKPEEALLSAMKGASMKFVAHAKPLQGVRRRADAVLTRARVCVFMDGCFWHGCPEHSRSVTLNGDYWNPKIKRNAERDRDTDARLAAADYAVIRVWEHDVKDAARLSAAVARIRGLVDRRTGRVQGEGPEQGAEEAGGDGGDLRHAHQGLPR
jgi:DNA mismatch endonuclease (patch repair protein)